MSLLCFRWSLCLSDGVGPLPVRFDVSSQLSLVDEESVYLVSACESALLFGLWLCTKKKTTFSSSACVHNNKLTTGELSAFLCLSFWKVWCKFPYSQRSTQTSNLLLNNCSAISVFFQDLKHDSGFKQGILLPASLCVVVEKAFINLTLIVHAILFI